MKYFAMFLVIISGFALLLTCIFIAVDSYQCRVEVTDYLKLAGDAPTVEKANSFLSSAIVGIEKRKLTSGSSAFFLHTPKSDLKLWYENVLGAHQTTETLLGKMVEDPNSVSQLDKDNALMKIREVLLDDGGSGTTVTTPPHISIFPHQLGYLFSYIGFIILGILGWMLFQYEKGRSWR